MSAHMVLAAEADLARVRSYAEVEKGRYSSKLAESEHPAVRRLAQFMLDLLDRDVEKAERRLEAYRHGR